MTRDFTTSNSPSARTVLVLCAWMSRAGGGLQSGVRDLVRALNVDDARRAAGTGATATRFDYRVLSLRDAWSDEDSASWGDTPLRIDRFIGPDNFRLSPAMLGHALRADAACIHLHGLWMFPSAVLRARQAKHRTPSVISPHGMLDPWILGRGRWKKAVVGALWEHANWTHARAFRALNAAEADAVRACVPGAAVCVIPNGVALPDLDDPQHVQADREPLRAAGLKCLYLGRLHEKKGVHLLLQAWAMIHRQPALREATLRICGWGDDAYVARCRALIQELALGDSVTLVGPVFGDAKLRELAGCSALVLPSYSEGLPMVVLEAWSHARPVLMTPECNLRIGFERGCAMGVSTDPASIAAAIIGFVALPTAERERMGRRGRELVAQDYSWADVARRTEELTRWAIDGGSFPGA